MEARPFDPVDYLDSEKGFAAYLADARTDGAKALADAIEVVAHGRDRMTKARIVVRFRVVPPKAVVAKNTGKDFRRGAVTARTQFQQPDGSWQKRDERSGQFMERKVGNGPFKGVAKETDGRDTDNS